MAYENNSRFNIAGRLHLRVKESAGRQSDVSAIACEGRGAGTREDEVTLLQNPGDCRRRGVGLCNNLLSPAHCQRRVMKSESPPAPDRDTNSRSASLHPV